MRRNRIAPCLKREKISFCVTTCIYIVRIRNKCNLYKTQKEQKCYFLNLIITQKILQIGNIHEETQILKIGHNLNTNMTSTTSINSASEQRKKCTIQRVYDCCPL